MTRINMHTAVACAAGAVVAVGVYCYARGHGVRIKLKTSVRAKKNSQDDSIWQPTMPEQRAVMDESSGIVARSIPLRNLPWVVKSIHEDFRRGVALCRNKAPTQGEAKPWQGTVSWARMCEIIQKERAWDKEIRGNLEGSFRVLEELADKDMWELTSHDLRMMLLLKETCVPAFEIKEVQTMFCAEPHKIALSYQWAAPFGEVFQGLSSVCSLDDCVWVDIMFNPQGASLDSKTLMEITRDIYLRCDRHVLLVLRGQRITSVMGRAWIALEVAVRAQDRDAPMVELVDPDNTAEDFYHKRKKSWWSKLLALFTFAVQHYDFFSNIKAHVPSDLELIRAAVLEGFGSESFPGKGPAGAFNMTVDCFFRLAGGIQCIERLHALPNHEGDKDLLRESWQVSQELQAQCKFRACLRVRELQLESVLHVHGPEHADVAATLSNIGSVHRELGDNAKALEHFERALSLDIKANGHEHLDVAASLNGIANVLLAQGKYELALAKYEEALEITTKILGHDHPKVAGGLDNIGLVYRNLADTAQTLQYHEKALAIKIKAKGHDHPDVAGTLSNIGILYRELGRSKEALAKYEECLRIERRHVGRDHPDVAATLNNIGNVYQQMGDYRAALAKHEEALRVRIQVLGRDHPLVAQSLSGIGAAHGMLGESERALEHFERALAIDVNANGREHPDVAKSYCNMSVVYEELGNLEKAVECGQEALQINQSVLGARHPETVKASQWLVHARVKLL